MPVAAQRDIEVIAEPARKGHVPAPPEILNTGGLVRGVEVPRQFNIEKEGTTDGHIAVAGKVEIKLQRIAESAKCRVTECERSGNIESMVDEGGKRVGDDDLLGKADTQHDKAAVDIVPADAPAQGVGKLGHHFAVMHDRPGNELGEEADKKPVVQGAFIRWIVLLGIDIAKIGDLLKGEERNADRKHDVLKRQICAEAVQAGKEEVRVLVIG